MTEALGAGECGAEPPPESAKVSPRRKRARGDCRARERGVALVVVVASLSLLSAFAMSFMGSMRLQTTLAVNETRNAQLRAALEGGIHAAIAALVHPNAQERWPVDGTPREYEVGGHPMSVSVYDERGKVDLNTAPASVVRRLLEAVTQTREEAEGIARRVLEGRESDVAAAGADRNPPGPWRSVMTLRYLEGMSETIFKRALPGLTVHSGLQTVRTAVAPKLALMAAATARSGEDEGAGDGEIFTIRAEIRGNGQARMSGEAIVWIVEHEHTRYRFLEWRIPALPYIDFEVRESELARVGREATGVVPRRDR